VHSAVEEATIPRTAVRRPVPGSPEPIGDGDPTDHELRRLADMIAERHAAVSVSEVLADPG
jgi:hypothetical protein